MTAPLLVQDDHALAEAFTLTPQERRFAEQYFSGETCGNATRSYLAIYPDANYATASVEASRLLKEPRVRSFLNALHREAIASTAEQLTPWTELLPTAQSVIVATAEGRLRNRLAYEAAVYLVNRVMGTPMASHEVHVRDHERAARAVTAFARRVSQETGRALCPRD